MINGTFLWKKITISFAGNNICARFFTRELKRKLIGDTSKKQQHKLVADKFYEKVSSTYDNEVPDVELHKSRYSEWYNGKRIPHIKFLGFVERIFPKLPSQWFFRFSPNSNPLQLHLSVLDIGCVWREHSKDVALAEAINTLRIVEDKWKPNYWGKVELVERDINNVTYLNTKPSSQTLASYNKLNSLSIIEFMFRYALESKLPTKELKTEFIFDFLSAVNASYFMMESDGTLMKTEFGFNFQIYNLCHRFFRDIDYGYDDPLWKYNAPVARFGKALDMLNISCNQEELWELLCTFKKLYYQTLTASGLSLERLAKQIRSNL